MAFNIYLLVLLFISHYEYTSSATTLTVDAKAGVHPISPYIYGLNFADKDFAKEIKLPFDRWGGNAVTRYNWKNDMSNHASDWFFENIPEENAHPETLPDGSKADQFVEKDKAVGARTMMTMPLIGWTPKDREKRCGFSVKKYGEQEKTDQYMPDCGNGNYKNGTAITGNDPTDTSVAINATFATEWVQHLVKKYNTSTKGGVLFYEMDNEYDLWTSTHRDVRPKDVGTDELVKLTEDYASAIKKVDPGAQVLGLVGWGLLSLFSSALDEHDSTYSDKDKKAHGNVDFAVAYLKAMKAYEDEHKLRIVDYLDCHIYPQEANIFQETNDATVNAVRLRSTRSLWDPTYVDESWIKDLGAPRSTIQFIPRLKKIVADGYPGTKTAITEYNWGGMTLLNGALTQADIFGIFGREGLDLASLWNPPKPTDPMAYAFRIYRNYDGKGGQFGDSSVSAKSSDEEKLAIYASLRSTDKKLIIIVINKDPTQVADTKVSISNFQSAAKAKVFTYSEKNLTKIVESETSITSNSIAYKFPAYSITLFEVSNK